jgi:tetratricopeptide (TPR) repeat protein
VYAVELTEQEPAAKAREAVKRVLEGYLASALEAADRMPIHFFGQYRDEDGPRLQRPADVVLDDPAAWFTAERRACVAAVRLAAEYGLDDLSWRMAATLAPYFDLRGHQDDWLSTHVIALAAARRAGSVRGEAIIQRNLGQVQLYQDSYDEAQTSFEQSMALYERIGDAQGVAITHSGLGTILRIQGEDERALDHCHASLKLFAEAEDPYGEAVARMGTGAVWMSRGAYATAKRWFTDALELSAATGDRHREAHALKRLGLLYQRMGNLGDAREHVDQAIAIFTELGDDHCVGYANQNLGELCLHSGDFAHAQLLLVNSLAVHRRNGDRRSEAEVSQLLGELHRALSQPERSRTYSERALAIWRELSARPQAVSPPEPLGPHIASA